MDLRTAEPGRLRRHPRGGIGDVHDPPAVGGGTVYVASEGHNNDGQWGYGGLYAFDAGTGEVAWTNRDSLRYRNPILVDGTVLVRDLTNGRVVAVDADSGDERWNLDFAHRLFGSPTATGGSVYVGTDAPLTEDASERYYDTEPVGEYPTVAAVDAADGSVRWAYAEPPEKGGGDPLYALTPVVTDRDIYVKVTGGYRDSRSKVLAIEASEDEIGPNHRPRDL